MCTYTSFQFSLTLKDVKVDVFWIVTPCSVAVGYRRFGGYADSSGEDLFVTNKLSYEISGFHSGENSSG